MRGSTRELPKRKAFVLPSSQQPGFSPLQLLKLNKRHTCVLPARTPLATSTHKTATESSLFGNSVSQEGDDGVLGKELPYQALRLFYIQHGLNRSRQLPLRGDETNEVAISRCSAKPRKEFTQLESGELSPCIT